MAAAQDRRDSQEAFPVSSSTPEQVTSAPEAGDGRPPRRGGLTRLLVLASVLTVLVVAAVAIPAYLVHQRNHTALAAQQPGCPVSRPASPPAWRT